MKPEDKEDQLIPFVPETIAPTMPQALTEGNLNVDPTWGLVPSMTPYNVSDKSVKTFVDSPLIAQASGRQNVGNLPPGEFLRDMSNTLPGTPVIPSAPPAVGGLVPTPNQPQMAKSPADIAREAGMAEWRAHQEAIASGAKSADSGFSLSPLFFAQHPEVSGGVFVGPNGPQFLFSSNKPKDMMGIANDLIRDYTDKILSGQAASEGRIGFYTDKINNLIAQATGMTTAQTGVAKAPSEIAKNTAEANRPQIVPNVAMGEPGGIGTMLVPPGGSPQVIAAGAHLPTPGSDLGNVLISQAHKTYEDNIYKILTDPLVPEDQRQGAVQNARKVFQENLQSIPTIVQQLAGKTGPAAAAKVTDEQYIEMFLKKNGDNPQNRILAQQYLQNARKLHPELFQ